MRKAPRNDQRRGAAPGGGSAVGQTGSLPFDTSVAHQARIYDYTLGGNDN
jgi:hypothetical protein